MARLGDAFTFTGAELANALEGHRFVTVIDGTRCTVEVTGLTHEDELIAKVVVP